MAKQKSEWKGVKEQQRKREGQRRRGRSEKPLKIKDTPRNVARALFGLGPIESESQESRTEKHTDTARRGLAVRGGARPGNAVRGRARQDKGNNRSCLECRPSKPSNPLSKSYFGI